MTINKLTNNVKPLDEVDKINETIQLLNGETTFTNSIKSSFNEAIKLEKSSSNAYVAVASRTDTNNKISLGIDSGGENRGIWDSKLNKWAFNIANNKAYALGNEISIKADLLTKIDGDNTRLHALKSYTDKGELLTDAEGLADVTDYAHSTFDASKFTVVGSPTITSDGIASGLSDINYLTNSNNTLTFGNHEVVYYFKDILLDVSVNSHALFTIYGTTSTGYFSLYCYGGSSSGKFEVVESGTGFQTAYILTQMLSTLDYTKPLDIEFKISGATVAIKIYQNGTLVGEEKTATLLVTPINGYVVFGTQKFNSSTNYNQFNGSIDLKQFSITVDGVEVFSGNKTGIDTIKPDDYTVVGSPTISADGIASGFTTTNNTIQSNTLNIDLSVHKLTIKARIKNDITNWNTVQNILIEPNTNWKIGINTISGTFQPIDAYNKQYCDPLFTSQAFANQIPNGAWYNLEFNLSANSVSYKIDCNGQSWTNSADINSQAIFGTLTKLKIGNGTTSYGFYGSIDLNAFKVYVDGNLVYQPCLKIPYTESKTGSKVVNAIYRDRVNDMAEQFGYAPYYTLSDTDYSLPQVELYGYIEKRARDAAHPIAVPFYRLDNTIYDDEVRLEGAEVDKGLYLAIEQKLASYCTASADPTKIILPNFIGKVPWGANDYGYISAGLPNITGTYRRSGSQRTDDATFSGSLYAYDSQSYGKASGDSNSNYNGYQVLGLDASRSSSIYSDSVTTVQPPAFKVRWLARYK